MVEGPGKIGGGLPEPIDGEGGEGADKAGGDAAQPPHAAKPRGSIDPRLSGLPGAAASASTPPASSSEDPGDEFRADLASFLDRAGKITTLRVLNNDWLPDRLRIAYEQSEQVDARARGVRNLAEVKAVLALEGVGGPPPLPEVNLRNVMPRLTGGREIPGRERPKPLSTLAMRISADEFPADERFQASMLVLNAIGAVEFKPHRVEPLAEMAEATSSVEDDAERTDVYRAVLRAAQGLWEEHKAAPESKSEIGSGEYVHILASLSLNSHAIRVERDATLAALRHAVEDEELTPEQRTTASSGLDD